jgi:hypothetical protein
LDIYLGSPVIPTHAEPLEYWTSINPQENPLAQMSYDFLPAPGMCSIDYSIAKDLHNTLSNDSTRAATVFGSWVGIEGLVVTEDLIR